MAVSLESAVRGGRMKALPFTSCATRTVPVIVWKVPSGSRCVTEAFDTTTIASGLALMMSFPSR